MKKPPVEVLGEHFEKNGWPENMNRTKLGERSHLSDEPCMGGCAIVEIERHRPVLGCSYIKGCPMGAFQTYWMRYAIQRQTGKVAELPERAGNVIIENLDLLVEDALDGWTCSVEKVGDKYKIHDDLAHEHAIVSSEDEATRFILSTMTNWTGYFMEQLEMILDDEGKEVCSNIDLNKIENQYQATLEKLVAAAISREFQAAEQGSDLAP